MGQDEKTAPGIRGVVRATPPVGTPLGPHHAPASPPSPPGTSPPRTVGGHTARLVTPVTPPDDDDRLGSGSVPMLTAKAWDHAGPSELPSQTIGGTARLEPVPLEQAAAAKRRFELEEQAALLRAPSPLSPPPPAPGRAPPPASPVSPVAAAPPGQSPPPAPLASPGPGLPPNGGAQGNPGYPANVLADDDASALSPLFAPLSVGVGLVFFAMGSMLTLTLTFGERIMASKPAVAVSAVAPPSVPSAPPAPSTHAASLAPPHVPAASATAVVPTTTGGTRPAQPLASAIAQAPETPPATAPGLGPDFTRPPASGPKPQAPSEPPASSGPIKQGGGAKRPALPFP